MRTRNERITLFCTLYKLTAKNARTTAGRKINKKKALAPVEEFFKQLSNEDLQNLLDFLSKKSSKLSISLQRDKNTEIIKSSVKTYSKLEILIEGSGKILRAHVPTNKSKKQILEEHWKEHEKNAREKAELQKQEDEEYENDRYFLENQKELNSPLAKQLFYFDGLHEEAFNEEEKYNLIQAGIFDINYKDFVVSESLIERYCESIFTKQISTLSMNESNKNIIDKMIITYKSYLLLIADSSKMESEFVLHLAKEKLLKLLKKHRVLFD